MHSGLKLSLLFSLLFAFSCQNNKREVDPGSAIGIGLRIPFEESVNWAIRFDSNNITLKTIVKELYVASLKGRVKAYDSDSLTLTIKVGDLAQLGSNEINPQDSALSPEIRQLGFVPFDFQKKSNGLRIKTKTSFNKNGGVFYEHLAIAITYPYVLNRKILLNPRQALYWMDLKEVKAFLSEEEFNTLSLALLTYMAFKLNTSDAFGEDIIELQLPIETYNERASQAVSRSTFQILEHIHDMVLNQNIRVYASDTLKRLLTEEEVKLKGAEEEVLQIYPDPNDAYNYYDSIVLIPYEANYARQFRVSSHWVTDGLQGELKPLAFALTKELYAQEVFIGNIPLYYVKMDELRAKLTSSDALWLDRLIQYYFNLMLTRPEKSE